VELLLSAGASLSDVDKQVIEPSVNLRKSSQTTQLYITKVFDKQFNCHDYIKKHFS
jgi:hypothetical protein